MQTLNLLLGADVQASPNDDDEVVRQRVEGVVVPLLERLASRPSVRCGLHLSGITDT